MRRFDLREAKKRMDRRRLNCSTVLRDLCRALGKAMVPHSSTVARKIPWMEEPGRLQSMGSLRVRHD